MGSIRKLNGWVRLWAFSSFILLIPAIFGAIVNLPTDDRVLDSLEASLLESGDLDLFEIVALHNLIDGEAIQETEDELNRTMTPLDGGKIIIDEESVMELHEEFLREKTLSTAKIFGLWVGGWLISMSVILLLGHGIAWVVAGFKNDEVRTL